MHETLRKLGLIEQPSEFLERTVLRGADEGPPWRAPESIQPSGATREALFKVTEEVFDTLGAENPVPLAAARLGFLELPSPGFDERVLDSMVAAIRDEETVPAEEYWATRLAFAQANDGRNLRELMRYYANRIRESGELNIAWELVVELAYELPVAEIELTWVISEEGEFPRAIVCRWPDTQTGQLADFEERFLKVAETLHGVLRVRLDRWDSADACPTIDTLQDALVDFGMQWVRGKSAETTDGAKTA